ncbi:hypothetical protein GCM10010341_22280 [Streptomyces noursei]|nr:hypothetical protein GCM10010341_22280 [Streptomyces noursei]
MTESRANSQSSPGSPRPTSYGSLKACAWAEETLTAECEREARRPLGLRRAVHLRMVSFRSVIPRAELDRRGYLAFVELAGAIRRYKSFVRPAAQDTA